MFKKLCQFGRYTLEEMANLPISLPESCTNTRKRKVISPELEEVKMGITGAIELPPVAPASQLPIKKQLLPLPHASHVTNRGSFFPASVP